MFTKGRLYFDFFRDTNPTAVNIAVFGFLHNNLCFSPIHQTIHF